ncbi:MAG: GNAT family N-acetyltransferase [Pseudomonadota bacterium]
MDSSHIGASRAPLPDTAFVPFGEEHLAGGVALSAAAGWTHRREDWAMLLRLSRGVAALQGVHVVGTAFRADFGAALSTVNMILVDETMRSRGLGRALITSAIGQEARSLRLVATVSGQPLYEKLGFKSVSQIVCAQGLVKDGGKTPGVRDALSEDLPQILALESASFGGDRSALVAWLCTTARVVVLERAGQVLGFAACRRFGKGHVIGPVVAPSAQDGLSLVGHLAEDLRGELVRLDVAETSGLQPGLTALGLEIRYHAPVMERGGVSARPERLALVSQALV